MNTDRRVAVFGAVQVKRFPDDSWIFQDATVAARTFKPAMDVNSIPVTHTVRDVDTH